MSKLYKSYKRDTIDKTYDYVFIGSGISSLTAASLLAERGKSCLILEKHYTPGGYTHVFKRKGYEWDVGVHYIGEVNRPHTVLARLFDFMSEGNLEWEDMGEVYDRIIFGNEHFDFHKGKENFKINLKKQFTAPEDQEAIEKYVDLVYKVTRTVQPFFAQKMLPKPVDFFLGSILRRKFLSYANRSTLNVLQELTSNKKLIAVLCGQFGDYGVPPSQSSFAMHAVLVKHYFNGAAYPVGGSSRMFDTIVPRINRNGGDVFVNAGVEEIIVENGAAVALRMQDGKTIKPAETIICSAGFNNTYDKLLKQNETFRNHYKITKENLSPSSGHISLYVGFESSVEELNLPKHNLWIYPENSYDHDKNINEYVEDPSKEIPLAYVSFPAAKDPDWNLRYPGRATLEIVSLAPMQWFEKWRATDWMNRGEEYESFKENLSQRLLRKLYDQIPHLEGKVSYYELSTPLSTIKFANYAEGEVYGIDHDVNRFSQRKLKPSTPIKNLYLSGQDIVSCGIGGAAMSGVITASVLIKGNAMAVINK